jgi:hypothetical protein
MIDWMVEHWFVEAVACIGTGLILAKLVCILADLLDRDQ